MSKRRISKTAGWIKTKDLPKGPDGRALCRWCGTGVPKGRRTFCSTECVHQHKLRSNPGYVRTCLFERDRGVCCLCGLDTVVTEQKIALEINQAKYRDQAKFQRLQEKFKAVLGIKFSGRRHGGYWDSDHTKPVVLGGGECGLDNYRTLCIPCHKIETAKLRKRLKSTTPS